VLPDTAGLEQVWMKKVSILIADDSVVYRSQIRAALTDIEWVEIVGAVSNGKLAIDKIKQVQVDLLILDLEMPEMDGLQTLAQITAQGLNCKVLVFSSVSKRGAEVTLEALRRGASDFITKPGHADNEEPLLANANPSLRIKMALEPKIAALFPEAQKHSQALHKSMAPGSNFPLLIWDLFQPQMIVIGSSTGGPTALENIFSKLSGVNFKCPILIAQHMPPIFTATLAERLKKVSGIDTQEAVHGSPILSNKAYIAPGNFHMTVAGSPEKPIVQLDQGPQINSVRPAVDPLFESAVQLYRDKVLGIVLTGMGADGKVGAEKIKQRGGAVVIQDKESCVVFGMPGAVMESGAYDKVLNLEGIVSVLIDKAGDARVSQTKNVTQGKV
jgi:two-component system chemotaxis response regulator CheB